MAIEAEMRLSSVRSTPTVGEREQADGGGRRRFIVVRLQMPEGSASVEEGGSLRSSGAHVEGNGGS